YHAFLTYKQEQEIRRTGGAVTDKNSVDVPTRPASQPTAVPAPKQEQSATSAVAPQKGAQHPLPIFKIQLLSSPTQISTNDRRLKGLKEVSFYRENGLYKYTYGASTDYNRMLRIRNEKILPLFKDAFMVAFKNGRKMDLQTAIDEFNEQTNDNEHD
ncbi:MAG: N-acetylmuramoyl-L-alanine amidase, partial [Prevotellaceae bacterium]|nr:N-acetylmuramoyl-L-alanine amidase [Prevotellaceae bacterium]